MDILLGILKEAGNIFMEASFYILFGLFISGILHVFIPTEKIGRYLGRGKVRSVIYSALFGMPIPLCSCGVVPTAVSLRKQGANKGATTAFLISTPESGADSILLTYALFDSIMAIARPVAALITAITAGILVNFSEEQEDHLKIIPEKAKSEPSDACCDNESGRKGNRRWMQKLSGGMRYAFVDLLNDISIWLLIGIFIAGLISYLVPESLIGKYIGGGISSMFIMLIMGIPLYVCASASTPIAAALVLKGLSPGAALVFLLAGPATNAASLTVVAKLLGKRAFAIYLTTIAVVSILSGLSLNWIYFSLGVRIKVLTGEATEIFSKPVHYGFAFLLILLIVWGLWIRCKIQNRKQDVV